MRGLLYFLSLLSFLSVALYGWGQKGPKCRVVLWVGFVGGILGFFVSPFFERGAPFFSMREGLGLLSLILVGLFLLLGKKEKGGLEGVVALLAFSFLLVATLLPSKRPAAEALLGSVWFSLHSVSCFIGMGGFALSFCSSLTYLLQDMRIKSKKSKGSFASYPSLEFLDRLSLYSLGIGFPFYTLGIIVGAVLAMRSIPGGLWDDPKTIGAGLLWLLYAFIAYRRFGLGWRGKRLSLLTVMGFGLLMFVFLGINLLLGGHHAAF